jgi:hypothetical protein
MILVLIFIIYTYQIISTRKGYLSGKIAVLILFLFSFYIFRYANSSSNDKACDILTWIIISLFLLKIENHTITKWDKKSWAILLLSAFIITIKVSSVIILLIPGILLFLTFRNQKKMVIYSFLIFCLSISIWLISNAIISGMLIFPLPLFRIQALDWCMPKNLVDQMTKVIYYFAIETYTSKDVIASMTIQEQYLLWQEHLLLIDKVLILVSFLGSLVILLIDTISLIKKGVIELQSDSIYLIIDIYFILALFFWVYSAPDPRFAYGLILTSIAYSVSRLMRTPTFSAVSIDAMILSICIYCIWSTYLIIPWNMLPKYILFPPEVTHYEIEEYIISDGNTIFKPVEGDQCWDAPLPCSGWIYDGVIMRTGELSDGFRIEK